jgi:hypothetical protein
VRWLKATILSRNPSILLQNNWLRRNLSLDPTLSCMNPVSTRRISVRSILYFHLHLVSQEYILQSRYYFSKPGVPKPYFAVWIWVARTFWWVGSRRTENRNWVKAAHVCPDCAKLPEWTCQIHSWNHQRLFCPDHLKQMVETATKGEGFFFLNWKFLYIFLYYFLFIRISVADEFLSLFL